METSDKKRLKAYSRMPCKGCRSNWTTEQGRNADCPAQQATTMIFRERFLFRNTQSISLPRSAVACRMRFLISSLIEHVENSVLSRQVEVLYHWDEHFPDRVVSGRIGAWHMTTISRALPFNSTLLYESFMMLGLRCKP